MKDILHQIIKKPLLAVAILLVLVVLVRVGATNLHFTLNLYTGNEASQINHYSGDGNVPVDLLPISAERQSAVIDEPPEASETAALPAPEDRPATALALTSEHFDAHGYHLIDQESFLTEVEKGYGYAAPASRITASDLKKLKLGYNIWTKFLYEFDDITDDELSAIRVDYQISWPDGARTRYDGGALGDGARIEFDRLDMPSLFTSFFGGDGGYPLGAYQLQLYFDGKLAGTSTIELVGDDDGRSIDIPRYEYLWNADIGQYVHEEKTPLIRSALGGGDGQRIPGGTTVKAISEPLVFEDRIWFEVRHGDASGFIPALDI